MIGFPPGREWQAESMKNILVTGGAGFVGSHLVEKLLENKGNRVFSLDNYFAGTKDNHIDGAEYIDGHTKDIAELINFRPDIIYHLGEYARVAKSLTEPDLVWDLNMAGTHGVLEFWRKNKCKLVYAGSSTKFVGERTDGTKGRDLAPYTWSKSANTEQVVNYARWYDLLFSIVYFYNVYGPRERSFENNGTLIETWKQKCLAGEPLPLRGNGEQKRSFTHVIDTVNGIVLAGEKGAGDGYGISAKEVYTLKEVADMFGIEIDFQPTTKSTREGTVVDTAQIEGLGWKQEFRLEDYVDKIKNSLK